MRQFSKGGRLFAFLLAVLMMVSAIPAMAFGVAAEEPAGTSEPTGQATPSASDIAAGAYKATAPYRAVMLDCGRKYFTVAQIKTLIDILEKDGYNQLQLSFGNDGFRFLLDDMTLTYDNGSGKTVTMASETFKKNVQTGNTATPNTRFENGNCLTEAEMDEILTYAGKHKIEIVPMINMPGHAYALVYGSGYAAEFQGAWGKHDDLNTNSPEALNFAYAVLAKYGTYFKDRGVRFFSFGADECGEATTVDFVLNAAKTIYDLGLTPRCFNDVFNSADRLTSLKKLQDYGTQICFWAQYASSYVSGIQTAEAVAKAGYDLINTNQNWYYVVNKQNNGTNYEQIKDGLCLQLPTNAESNQGYSAMDQFCTRQGSSGVDAVKNVTLSSAYTDQIKGSMFCMWFDYPKLMTADEILSTTSRTGAGYQLTCLANKYWPQDVKVSSASEWSNVKTMSADTYYENGTVKKDSGAATWLKNNRSDGISGVNNIMFRGWAGTDGNKVIAAFGYTLDDSTDAVWSTSFIKAAESAVTNGAGSNAKRYEITVDLSKMPSNETHTLTLLVKTVDGAVYKLDQWGTVKVSGNLKVADTSTGMVGHALDAFSIADFALENSVFDKLSALGNKVTIDATAAHDTAYFKGWIGMGQEIKQLGYVIDGGDYVWDVGSINRSPEAAVKTHGGEYAVRLAINVPTADLEVGTHSVSVLLKLADGTVVSYCSVQVVVEDENTLPDIQQNIERFMTSQYIGTWTGEYDDATMYGQHIQTLRPEDAYSQDGVELHDIVLRKGTNEDGFESWYWKGTILSPANKQGSNQNPSHGGSSTDMSSKGTDFCFIRFWQGKWSVKADAKSTTWIDIQSSDQVVAYYMQLSTTSKEINITFRDYARIAGQWYPTLTPVVRYQNGQDVLLDSNKMGGYAGEEQMGMSDGFYGVGSAVVYPDRSMSLTEDEIWDQTLLLFYDRYQPVEGGKLRTPGIVKVYDSEDFLVTKITITRGHHVPVKHGISEDDNAWKTQRYWYGDTDYVKWNKVKVGDNEWYDEDILWTRQAGEDYSSGILLDADKFEPYRTTLDVVGEAYLLLFYVEPVVKEDNLKVVYVDDSAKETVEIIRKDISVMEGTTFFNGLTVDSTTGNLSKGDLGLTAGKTLSIKNSTGSTQNINYEKLSLVPDIDKKYATGDYYYVSADLSEDGKTLTLHYRLKSALKVQYYYDDADGNSTLINIDPDYLIYVEDGRRFTDGIQVNGGTAGAYTAEQLTALIKAGNAFTILGLTEKKDGASEENVPIYTTLKQLADLNRISTEEAYRDFRENPTTYAFSYAEYGNDGDLLILHYIKTVSLKVVYWDDNADEEIASIPDFAITEDETFAENYGKDDTITITDKDGDEKTVEKDLSKLPDDKLPADKKDDYKDHYVDRIAVSEDGETLIIHYKAKSTLTVNYYDKTNENYLIKSLTETNAPDGAAWTNTNGVWSAPTLTTPWTAELVLSSVSGVVAPYNVVGKYVLVAADTTTTDEGRTLNLYYELVTLPVTIVWVDEEGNQIEIETDYRIEYGKTLEDVLGDATISGSDVTLGDEPTLTEWNGTEQTIIKNLPDMSGIDEKYQDGSYVYDKADLSEDGMTLTLHYVRKKNMNVVWVAKVDTTEIVIHEDSTSPGLTNLPWATTWNEATLSNGSYTAETDLNKIEKVDSEYKKLLKYSGEAKVDGNTLYLYYTLAVVQVTVQWWDDSANDRITKSDYIIYDNTTLKDSLTDVTVDENGKATLGENPTLTDYEKEEKSIEKDLLELVNRDVDEKYQTGLYEYVEADLSEDGKTLTLHYKLKTFDKTVSYVLDYGLPVKIDDLKGLFNKQYGIEKSDIQLISPDEGTELNYADVLWDDADWNHLTYKLHMRMEGVDTVVLTAYVSDEAIKATLTLKFIPAHNIYYEDSFGLNFLTPERGGFELDGKDTQIEWETIDAGKELFQRADPVGSYRFYGSDPAYTNDGFGLSAGSALKVTVPYIPKGTEGVFYPTVSFTFTGTGFDIISRTGADQGRIGVTITKGDEVYEYGVINRGDNELFQVPVMSVEGLEHGTYEVTITVYPPMEMINRETGEKKFLYGTAQGATFVLDGIRIYDPVDTSKEENAEVLAAYEADDQVVVSRREYRDLLINQGDELNVTVDQGMGTATDLAGFTNIGPNNEVYLAPGQSIEIELDLRAYELIVPRARALFKKAQLGWTFKLGDITAPAGEFTLGWNADMVVTEEGAPEEDLTITVVFTNVSEDPDAWIALTDLVITQFNPPEVSE